MTEYNWTNVSRVIQSEVSTLQTEFSRLLAQKLLGIYLHGSLALGNFQPARSDINIIVVVTEEIAVELKRELVGLLSRISQMPRPLDVYVLVEKDIASFQTPLPFDFHYNERLREMLQQDLRSGNWQHWNETNRSDTDLIISLVVLQRAGIIIVGKPMQETLPVVPEAAFREALVRSLQIAHAKLPEDPSSYVLNACRTIAYMQEGTILSKDGGGNWGLAHLPEEYHALIQQSLALYRHESLKRPAGRAVLNAFAVYIDHRINLRGNR